MKSLLKISIVAAAMFIGSSASQPEHAMAATQEYTCTVQDVREWLVNVACTGAGCVQGIVVTCKNTMTFNGQTVNSMAVASNTPHAMRFLSQAQAAMLSGKQFFGLIETTFPYRGEIRGCPASSCRVITDMYGIWH